MIFAYRPCRLPFDDGNFPISSGAVVAEEQVQGTAAGIRLLESLQQKIRRLSFDDSVCVLAGPPHVGDTYCSPGRGRR